ncbi:hypothetical protein KUTeg_006128 [Tegillarca granosa]|uniref:Ig-like domain-containing protein n=1 Tax=Tegillarca granosa TaxID=220873 RepID=A0ABQ9FFN7_TEGGR|nr:hypothetical protein KUTeg_006128 [Tegillarca granosa]
MDILQILFLTVFVKISEAVTTITPSNSFAVKGQSFNLTCDTGNDTSERVEWFRDEVRHDFPCDVSETNQSSKYSATCVNKNRIILSISANAIETEHGIKWQCFGQIKSKEFIIKVYYPPTVTVSVFEEQLWNGTRYSIYCQVKIGNPSNFTILWSQTVANTIIRTNADLSNYRSNGGHNLTITAVSYQDIGIYTCSVQNNVTDCNGNLLQNESTSIKRNSVFTDKNYTIFHVVLGKSFDVRIPFYCQPNVQNKEDLELTRIENNDQSIKNNSDLEFHLETTKVKIPFYQKFVSVEGQVAVMTFKFISDTTQGSYLLKIPNMENKSSNFQFKIEVHDPEKQTNLPLIIGCSTAVSFVVAIVVVVVVCVFMKHKTNVGNVYFCH